MPTRTNISEKAASWLDVSTSDPDDKRRRKLLNIILTGTGILSILTIIAIIIVSSLNLTQTSSSDVLLIIFSGISILAIVFACYVLNRNENLPGWIASTLFILFLMIILGFSDTPKELAGGRSLFTFILPVVISGILLPPIFSFIFFGLVSLEIAILGRIGNVETNQLAFITFFLIAVISWLSSRAVEQAIKDLRNLNSELDQRVEERTRELAEALTREFAETGKNQAILEGIADGVLVFGPDEKMIVANPSVCQLLNIARDQLINKSIDEFIATGPLTAQDGGKLLKLLTSPDKEAPSTRFVWGKRTISVTTAAVVTPIGVPIGTVAVFRDFTREAEVEQMKNTFVAIVSHELRTPLNAILAYAEMIQGGVYGEVNPKQANAAARIFSNTQRLIGLVSDLLDQARLEAGKLKINIEEFPISEAVYAMHSIMEKPAKDKGLQLVIEIEPTVTKTVWGDSHRYQQILINLVNNAVKFTETGQVAVRIYQPDNDHWAIDVKDTGPGIPQDAIAYIFDTFRQVDGVTIRQHGGAGLGLSIVKRLVELMGGNIKVTSTLNQGSTFTVRMPVKPQEVNQGVKA